MTSTPFDTMLRTSGRRLVPVALIGLALVPGCAAPASKGQNAQGQNVTSTCFYYRAQYADAMAAFMRHQDTDPAAAAVDVRTAARMVLRYRATDDADHDTCFGPDELELMRRVYGDNGS